MPLPLRHRYIVHVDAAEDADRRGQREVVHAASVADAPLPGNVARRGDLPDDAGWWGFSFRDVPSRKVGPTSILEVEGAEVLLAREPAGRRNVYPAILDDRGRSLDLNQIRYRPIHYPLPRRADRYIPEGVWIAERVYDNHAHWLTAHLPKLILLRDRGRIGELVLPAELTPVIRTSLAWLGIDPARLPHDRPGRTGPVRSPDAARDRSFPPRTPPFRARRVRPAGHRRAPRLRHAPLRPRPAVARGRGGPCGPRPARLRGGGNGDAELR